MLKDSQDFLVEFWRYIYQTDTGTIFRPESDYSLMFDKNFK